MNLTLCDRACADDRRPERTRAAEPTSADLGDEERRARDARPALPTTYPARMPSVTGEVNARARNGPLISTPGVGQREQRHDDVASSTGGRRCCSRSFGEIDVDRLMLATRPAPASAARVNSRNCSVASSRSLRAAGYACVEQAPSPGRPPPDRRRERRNAAHATSPSTRYTTPCRTPSAWPANTTANVASPASRSGSRDVVVL